jgi:hypothetical protein
MLSSASVSGLSPNNALAKSAQTSEGPLIIYKSSATRTLPVTPRDLIYQGGHDVSTHDILGYSKKTPCLTFKPVRPWDEGVNAARDSCIWCTDQVCYERFLSGKMTEGGSENSRWRR